MDKYLELLTSKLEERKKRLNEFLCGGGAPDYAEYKSLCGEIRGLSVAQTEIEELVRKLQELDDA